MGAVMNTASCQKCMKQAYILFSMGTNLIFYCIKELHVGICTEITYLHMYHIHALVQYYACYIHLTKCVVRDCCEDVMSFQGLGCHLGT